MIKRKRWLDKEIIFLKKNYKTMFYLDIAKRLNRTLESIKHKTKRLELRSGKRSHTGLNQKGSNNHNWKGGISNENYRYKKIQLQRYPEKDRSGKLLRKAVKKGKIKKPNECEKCKDNGKLQGHHEDYTKPLEVIWLCKKCHNKIHYYQVIRKI